MELGRKLRKLRIEKEVSQEAISNELNIAQSTYSRIESDKISPKAEIIKKLSLYFDTSVNYFFTD